MELSRCETLRAHVRERRLVNVKLSLQYAHHAKFNGAGTAYDGLGRDASDNDTRYRLPWFAY